MANIDFEHPLSLAEVTKDATLGSNKSSWVKTLTALAEGVKNGKGEYDTFYKVGTFKNPSGAQTAIRGIVNEHADELPAEFDLRPVVKADPNDPNKRVSYMYAAVASPEDDDEDDEETGDDDSGDDETPEVPEAADNSEAPAKPKARARK